MSFDYLQIKYPPTIISFQDAMKLLKKARDAYEEGSAADCNDALREIAKAFERRGEA